MWTPSSGSKNKPSEKGTRSRQQTQQVLFFDPDDGDERFLRSVRCLSTDYTALYPRRLNSPQPPVWEPQILHRKALFYEGGTTGLRHSDRWDKKDTKGWGSVPHSYPYRSDDNREQTFGVVCRNQQRHIRFRLEEASLCVLTQLCDAHFQAAVVAHRVLLCRNLKLMY
jgi:hypothetical protein